MFVDSLELLSPAEFQASLASLVRDTPQSSLFVFIHGYNVPFEDAALRTAQLAADMNFPGVPVFYSWPSQGTMVRYAEDKENARNSGEYLARFLEELGRTQPGTRIHLVAHSMGSEVLNQAIEHLERSSATLRFGQVVLIAPDLDVRPFRRGGLKRLRKYSDRVTLYASNEDLALKASRSMQGVWRLGLGGDSLVVLPDMDTIDATRVRTDLLGHGPFGSPSFLFDLSTVLNEGHPPPRQLLRIDRGELAFWRFRP